MKLAANAELRNVCLFVAQQINRAAEKNRAFIGPGFAGDDVHHGGFTGTVGANNAAQLTGRNVQAELVDGLETIKADTDIFKVQNTAMGDVDFARHHHPSVARTATARRSIALVSIECG